MTVSRTTPAVSFNTGISDAHFSEAPEGQTPGLTQKSVLPGSTTVSEALATVFPKDPTVAGQLMGLMAAAGNSVLLRTGGGFRQSAKKTIRSLRDRGTAASRGAAQEIETLLDDTELLDRYRASLLET